MKESLAKDLIKVDQSDADSDNEFMIAKLNNVAPALSIAMFYGIQSNTFNSGMVERHIHEFFGAVKKRIDLGETVLVCGDYNVHIGDEMLKGNDTSINKGGRLFLDYVENMSPKSSLSVSD